MHTPSECGISHETELPDETGLVRLLGFINRPIKLIFRQMPRHFYPTTCRHWGLDSLKAQTLRRPLGGAHPSEPHQITAASAYGPIERLLRDSDEISLRTNIYVRMKY